MLAYADRLGVIYFADDLEHVPDGMAIFAHGNDPAALMNEVEVRARHAYDGKSLLVPGVPEAASDEAAGLALAAWQEWAFPDADVIVVKGKGPLFAGELLERA